MKWLIQNDSITFLGVTRIVHHGFRNEQLVQKNCKGNILIVKIC